MAEISDERNRSDAAFLEGMALGFDADENEHSKVGAARLREISGRLRAEARPEPLPAGTVTDDWQKLDGNEIWEWLFGALKGDVPDALTEDVLSELALYINAAFAARPAEPVAVKTYAEIVAPYVAAQRMVREAIGELFGPTASIESDEAVLLRGPEPTHEAEAQIAALQRIRSALVSTPAPGLVEALEVARRWLANSMPIVEIDGPKPLPLIDAVLSSITETGGAK